MPYKNQEQNKQYFRDYTMIRYYNRKDIVTKKLGKHCHKCNKKTILLNMTWKDGVKQRFVASRILLFGDKKFDNLLQQCTLLCGACLSARRPYNHGKQSTYRNKKCRCQLCIQANKDANRHATNQRKMRAKINA